MGFFGWLTLALIILKLTGLSDFSWWWILAPMTISVILDVVSGIILDKLDNKPATGKDLKRAFRILDKMEKNK
jgi:hypothetical protein